MKRLIEKIVFSGLVTAWRLATWPTSRSPLLVKRHHRRRGAAAFLVRDHRRLAAFHHGDHRVRRSQVDSDNLAHVMIPPPILLGRVAQARNDRLAFSTAHYRM